MPGKRVQFDDETWQAIRLLASDTMKDFQELADEAFSDWPAPGSEDTELGVLMELEVGHGEASVYAGVQA
ncbi:MAG: hypothetical protein J0H17_05690 [Rhizobiales bacterium]|nr:hypothetical protein [Hyphomicrobiales bacterium]